ncbi:MAG: hypothetical protein GX607_16675 [Myxococcales bacterium]|jgi:hypothetical protein|nr:hypothetical protein [Myxococcales bacterium]
MSTAPREDLLTRASFFSVVPSSVRLALGALLGCSIPLAVGCGPSMQVLHEGTVRFEHCYRLDLDPKIAPSHRKACWQAWSERHSYGQPRDRLEYARRRVQEIESNGPAPRLELGAAAERSALAEPGGPINVHAPPPRVARPPQGIPVSNTQALEGVPGDGCSATCRQRRTTCLASCAEGAPQCPCDADYRACMVRCFE